MRSHQNPDTVLDAETTATAGTASRVKDYRHIMVEVVAVAYTGTLKFAGSFKQTGVPDFGAAKSLTNPFDYVQIKDLEDNSAIDGDTGIAFSASTDVRQFEVNVNALTWISAITSSVSAGAITVKIIPFND